MAWFWTDDLARALVAEGLVERPLVEDWIARPVAVAGPDGAEPVEVARAAMGLDETSAGAA